MTREELEQRDWRRRLAGLTLALLTGLTLVVMIVLYYSYYQSQAAPRQPIPFSHRIHAGERQISCLICHPGVVDTNRAGVPPLQTCMHCHQHVIIHHPQIEKLTQAYNTNTPVDWVRVNDVPEFVYFSHQRHVQSAIDCAQCHGNVKAMDRVRYVHKFEMGYCMQCHRDYRASHDCSTCHR